MTNNPAEIETPAPPFAARVVVLESDGSVSILYEGYASKAQRIAACWNAFLDASTDQIREFSDGRQVPELVDYLRGRLDRAEEALEACRDRLTRMSSLASGAETGS